MKARVFSVLFCLFAISGCEVSRDILIESTSRPTKTPELIGTLVFPTGKGDQDVAAIEFRRLDQTVLLVWVDPAQVTGNFTMATPINFDEPHSYPGSPFEGEFIASGISAVASDSSDSPELQNNSSTHDVGLFTVRSTVPKKAFVLIVKLEKPGFVKWKLWFVDDIFLFLL